MSIFECNLVRKVYLDDSYGLKATIIRTETTQGHTEYVIRVKRYLTENSWIVHRRYNDFLSLHHSLQPSGVTLPLPPKKIIGNMNRNFIAERQVALQNYLDTVLNHCFLASQLVVKKFLDPNNYINFKELGLTGITIGVRGETDIKVIKQLPQIGSRLRKEYYLVKMLDSKQEMILSWLPFGPDTPLDQKQINALLKVLTSLQHVNIANLVKAGVCNDGAWIVREIRKTGSILDIICGTTKSPWTEQGIKKYSNFEVRKSLSPETIVDIVSQILQALAFLHHKGIPYGHLHNGNIVYEEGLVKLLDIENGMLGVSNINRIQLTKIKQINSIQAIDVYCLGLAVYEMATSVPYSHQKEDFTNIPKQLRPFLELLLSTKSGRNGLPSVADLLNIDLFRQTPPNPQPHIKLTTSAKQNFGTCAGATIERIKNDYNRYRQEKRVLKVFEGLDESEGQILLCYKKKTKNSGTEDDINGNNPHERSGSPSSSNSNTNTTISGLSGVLPVNFHTEPSGRQALLGAICCFNKDSLRKINRPPCV